MGETIALPPGELDRQEIVLQGDVIFSELARPRYDDVTCTDYATVIARQGILSRSVLLGGMVCVAGCSVRQPATAAPRPSAVVDLARDEVEVYGKALETLYAHTEERPGEIVVFDSLEYGLSVDCGGRTCLSPEVDSWVQKSTLAAY